MGRFGLDPRVPSFSSQRQVYMSTLAQRHMSLLHAPTWEVGEAAILAPSVLEGQLRFQGVFALGTHQPARQAPGHLQAVLNGIDEMGTVRRAWPEVRKRRGRLHVLLTPWM